MKQKDYFQKLLILIPTYNESKNIPVLFQNFSQFTPYAGLLFIDDNSQDNTKGEIEKQKKNFLGEVEIYTRKEKLGLASAYIDGMKRGLKKKYQFFLQMDADMSHHPKYIPAMLEKIQDYDFVIGSRYITNGGVKNWSWFRKFVSYGGNLYARIILRSKIQDLTGGFNLWRREVLEKINFEKILSQGYTFQIEMKTRAKNSGFRWCEVPIIFADRFWGVSKLDQEIVLEAIKNVWKIPR